MLNQVNQTSIQQAKKLMDQAHRIGIISHRGPDADAVGANLAIKLALEPLGKKVTSLCIDPVPPNCQFMPQSRNFQQEFNYEDFDLYIIVDCGAHYMTKYHDKKPELLSKKIPIINIDHHASNDDFGTVNLVQRDAASTTFMLWHFFKDWQFTITPHIATCLMAGLYFDTGSFQHDNTNAEVLRCASDLTEHQANIPLISYNLFKQTNIPKLKLWGRVLSRTKINSKQIASSIITEQDLRDTGANSKDSEGLIDYITAARGNKFAILLKEDNQGGIKGSLRTQTEIDVSKIAGIFGGGGHRKASGFRIPGRLKPEIEWLVS